MDGPSAPRRVALLAGGHASEHEISLLSGATLRDGLLAAGFEVHPVLIARTGPWSLLPAERAGVAPAPFPAAVDGALAGAEVAGDPLRVASALVARGIVAVVPALHGPLGEDGTIQGFFEVAGIPCAGCPLLASAVAMDKVLFKRLLAGAGLPTPPFVEIDRTAWAAGGAGACLSGDVAALGTRVVVKPVALGSSVGVQMVDDAAALAGAVLAALRHDRRVMVERRIDGLEVTCPVRGTAEAPEALPLIEIRPRLAAWFDAASKYQPGGADEIVPARLPAAMTRAVQELARRTHALIRARGLSRTDVMIDASGRPWILETNTLPGMTRGSLYPKALAAAGIGLDAFVRDLVDEALCA